jgi:hypothetical protein
MQDRWLGAALALGLAGALGFGAATVLEPVEARADGSERVVQIADETAYLMFVNHPTPPNTTYNVRGNFTAVAYEEWVHVAFADGKQYVIPRGQVVYMGTEEIR